MTTSAPISRVSQATARAATQAVQIVQQEGPGWLGGVAAGVQAAMFSCALVLIPMWVFTAATADTAVTWSSSTGMAVRVWLMGYGVPWAVDGVPISLVPLGIPALTALMLTQLARRFASATWTAGTAAVLAFAGVVAGLCAMAWSGAPDAGDRVTRAAIVAIVLAIPAVAWGLIRQRGAVLAWLDSIPSAVRAGVRLSVAMTGTLVVAAALLCAGFVAAHRHVLAQTATALQPDTVSGVTLALLETIYAPTLIVWAMAWLTGAGYDLGGVTHVPAAASDPSGPVPLLAALPDGGGIFAWAPWLVVLIGAVMAGVLRKRIGRGLHALAAIGVAVALSAAAIALAVAAATGSMGPGTFSAVGPAAGSTVLLVVAELGGGAILAAATWHALAALYGTTTIRVKPRGPERTSPRKAASSPQATEPQSRSDQGHSRDSQRDTGSPAAE